MSKKFLSFSNFKVKIDMNQLMREITVQNKNKAAVALSIRQEILPKVEQAQQEMIKDFSSHAVSAEIEGGPTASNLSGTLGGYGNLFSFIGFSQGEDPLSAIKDMLSKKIDVRVRGIGLGKFKITVFVPSKEEIFSVTPLPWASGASWAESIERGLSNLGSYLYSSSGFRESSSGHAIQVKNLKKSVTFKTTPYISKIMSDFRKNLENIK